MGNALVFLASSVSGGDSHHAKCGALTGSEVHVNTYAYCCFSYGGGNNVERKDFGRVYVSGEGVEAGPTCRTEDSLCTKPKWNIWLLLTSMCSGRQVRDPALSERGVRFWHDPCPTVP